jgi:hypothetical protein
LSAKALKPGARVVTQGRSLLANNDKVAAKLEEPKRDEGGRK